MTNRMWIPAIIMPAALVACGSRSSTSSEASPVPSPAVVEPAPTAYAISNAVDPIIRRALTDEGIPGAAFVFVHGNQVVYAQGYGMADQERRVVVDIERTVWRWGYAFQLDVDNGRQLAEHGGDIAGFSSLLTLIPEERSAFFIVNHGEGNDLRFRVKRALLDALYPGPQARVVPKADPARTPGLREYEGRYRSSLACHSCRDVDPEQDFEIAVRADGALELWGQEWLPLERDLFVRADGERLLGFARDNVDHVAVVGGGSWRVADRLAETPP